MATEMAGVIDSSSNGREEDEEPVNSKKPSNSLTNKVKGLIKKKDPSEIHSRKPPGNKWLQQQIPACRPLFTGIHTFVGFLAIGIAFLIMGGVFTSYSTQLQQYEKSYTNCGPIDSDEPEVRLYDTCEAYLASISNLTNIQRRSLPDCHCNVNITLTEDMRPTWYFYYGMRNYYQNHRRYVNSWDVNQLRGARLTRTPSADCRPFVTLTDPERNDTNKFPVVPCGLIANSWFNDSFDVFNKVDGSMSVTLNRTNIAWGTDRTVRFQNPNGEVNVSADDLVGTVRPPNWVHDLSEIPGGLENESLIVWFRVSAFPWFKKLYARPFVNDNEGTALPRGEYNIVLTYNYPVSPFRGEKSIILAQVNWLGGRNYFLGIAYLVVGLFLIISAFVVLIMHKMCSKWKTSKAPF